MGITQDSSSRRALLAGVAIGVAGVAADAAVPGAADAANGGAVILGADNTATGETIIDTTATPSAAALAVGSSSADWAFLATNDGAGASVYAQNDGVGPGAHSQAVGAEGVYARSGLTDGLNPGLTRSGVHGVTDSPDDSAVWGEAVGGGVGVMGSTTSSSQAAVSGTNSGTGYGINAVSSHGTGLHAQGSVAGLQVEGAAVFSRSGVATVAGTTASPRMDAPLTKSLSTVRSSSALITSSSSPSNSSTNNPSLRSPRLVTSTKIFP